MSLKRAIDVILIALFRVGQYRGIYFFATNNNDGLFSKNDTS